MKFKKGHSGNPGGRPKGVMAYVQEKCGADGKRLIDELVRMAFDDEVSNRDRLTALSVLLDRGWNKPQQGMYFSDEMRPLVIDCVTEADLAAKRAEAQ